MDSLFLRLFAPKLYGCGAVRFGSFDLKIHQTYPDAPKLPFYVDLRVIQSFPTVIDAVAETMADRLVAWMKATGADIDLLVPVPTAATPIITLVSNKLKIGMITPRFDKKEYGIKRQIDGVWQMGQTVAVGDDLRTTGGSKDEVVNLLREVELKPVVVFCFLERGAVEGAPVAGLPFIYVFTWSELLNLLHEERVGEAASQEFYERCLAYPAELAAFLKKHKTD